MRKLFLLIVAISVAGMSGGTVANEENQVAYPDGYRSWHHVKSMLIQPGHSLENPFLGIHHVYANKQAKDGLDDGTFNDGSVLAFDLLAYVEQDNAIVEGERKLLGVMVKDSQKYKATGGWGFEGFAGDSTTNRLVSDGGTSCYSCHTAVEASGYVFSQHRR